MNTLICANNVDVLKAVDDNSIDSIVTDSPYGLSFMGKKWDYDVPGVEIWKECFRVLKPGGHLLSFFGTRTYHRGVVNIEDAGFEIRDQIGWAYGSGFPKSHDVSKAMDKTAGAEREVISTRAKRGAFGGVAYAQDKWTLAQANQPLDLPVTAPATPETQQWQGWGTALKPAWEPICMARKPIEGTVAANVLQYRTGALNIDGCRVSTNGEVIHTPQSDPANREGVVGTDLGISRANTDKFQAAQQASIKRTNTLGRWPANLIHDGSEEVVELFPQSKSSGGVNTHGHNGEMRMGRTSGQGANAGGLGDSGSAARFFYCAKTSKKERTCGGKVENKHPTVKPLDLMQYLCRLVTPRGGIVLDPFCGSGSTLVAAAKEGFYYFGIDNDPAAIAIAESRLAELKEVA